MKLLLFHGRHDADEDMDDCGFLGPELENVRYMHSVYGNLTIGFHTRIAAQNAHELTGWPFFDTTVLEVLTHDDMVRIAPSEGRPPISAIGSCRPEPVSSIDPHFNLTANTQRCAAHWKFVRNLDNHSRTRLATLVYFCKSPEVRE